MKYLWRICFFGGLYLEDAQGNQTRRFRSQKAATLLAYLAYHVGQPLTREVLCDLLWKEEQLPIARQRLRVLLTSIRHQLEPGGIVQGTVLESIGNEAVRLRSDVVLTDLIEAQHALKQGETPRVPAAFLPNIYDDWALRERDYWEPYVANVAPVTKALPLSYSPFSISTSSPISASSPTLPLYLTPFFGRETECQEIKALLKQKTRLITVLGTGGIGKTRCVTEVLRSWDDSPFWFCSLAGVSHAEAVATTLVEVLERKNTTDALESIVEVLSRFSGALIVLDNAEHMLEEVVTLVETLLQRLPTVMFLITSRQSLHLAGETIYPLSPLDLPTSDASPKCLLEFASIALFTERAKASRPDFALTPALTPVVLALCQHLDGLPLALELAASRLSVLSPGQILAQVTAQSGALQTRQRGIPERHRTLLATQEWSYQLLTPTQQRFFTHLSIFQGTWSAEAALAVSCEPRTLEYLEDFAACSLLQTHTLNNNNNSNSVVRFSLLQTMQQFAQSKLSPEEKHALQERHAAFYLPIHQQNSELFATQTYVEQEASNLQEALSFLSRTNPQEAFHLLTLLLAVWRTQGSYALAERWIDWAESHLSLLFLSEKNDTYPHLLYAMSCLFADTGRLERAAYYTERLAALEDPIASILANTQYGYLANQRGEGEVAIAFHQKAIALARQINNKPFVYRPLTMLGRAYGGQAALATSQEARLLLWQKAEQAYQEALDTLPKDNRLYSIALLGVGYSLLYQGRLTESKPRIYEARQLAWNHHQMPLFLYTLMHESHLHCLQENSEEATRLWGAFKSLEHRMGYQTNPSEASERHQHQEKLQEALGEKAYFLLYKEGSQIPLESLFEVPKSEGLHSASSSVILG
jgi:predicted ATPase/DNA-binding winged helix-turn-helix (wHTH) protein